MLLAAAIPFFAPNALACPPERPLEAQLDLAETVVSGTIVKLEPDPKERDMALRHGTATIEVKETLKGAHRPSVLVTVEISVTKDYRGCSIPSIRKLGDSGIWVILPGGWLPRGYGLLPDKDKESVQKALKGLAERKWSEEAGGLKVWAGVVRAYDGRDVILFAAKNVGAGDLFYPIPDNSGVALMAVVGADGKTYSPRAKAAKAPDPKERVFCWKAAPGETVYLHPMYSWIDPLRDFDLPPGTYSVTVTYENQREGRFSPRAEGSVPISAWKGKLSAPSVTFTVPAPKAPQKPPPPQPAPKPKEPLKQ